MEEIKHHQMWQQEITSQGQNSWLEDHGLYTVASAIAAPFKAIGDYIPSNRVSEFFHDHPTVKHLTFGALGIGAVLGLSALIGFGGRFHIIDAIKSSWWFKDIYSTGVMMVGLMAIAATCLTIGDDSPWSSAKLSIVLVGLQVTGTFALFGVFR